MPSLIHITEIDSTNNYLKQLVYNQNVEEGTVVYCDFQTAGKGQRGNSWESEYGKNLTFSMVLYPNEIKAKEQFIISQLVSLSIAECLSKHTDNITIKWPNDIYWNNKKICGILIENALESDFIKSSVIGIGININQEKFVSNAPNPISLKNITGEEYVLTNLLTGIQDSILHLYSQIKEGKKEFICQRYKELLFRREGYHLYNDGTSDFEAKIVSVESDGILTLETQEGIRRKFTFKEVKFILD